MRVTYFRDDGNLLICTHAFMKDQRRTPPGEIARALSIHDEYFRAKRAGQITIETLGDDNG